jgi:branched-subunit amino acid transport protein
MSAVVAMLLLAGVCWLFRIVLIVLVPAERLPSQAKEGLAQLAPAVLAALVAVETDAAAHGSGAMATAVVVGALVAAGLAVRLTGSLLLAIGIGAGAALVLDLLILG